METRIFDIPLAYAETRIFGIPLADVIHYGGTG